jgi:hypothetical protein
VPSQGIEAEERGQAEAIARNLFEMAQLKVPIVSVVIGEGASGGAIGIGLGDRVFMLENTWYSVISPESCSSILWRSWDYKEQAAEALKLTADDMFQFGLIDGIIKEPTRRSPFGNPEEMAKMLKSFLDNKHDTENYTFDYYNLKNIDWAQRAKGEHVDEFVNQPFDILIAAMLKSSQHAEFIAATSKASIKAGPIPDYVPEAFDVMIDYKTGTDLPEFLKQIESLLRKTQASAQSIVV